MSATPAEPASQVDIPLPTGATAAGNNHRESVLGADLVEKVRKEAVFDAKGQQISFDDLIACEGEQKAIVIFIRHFVCGMCQDYVAAMVSKVNREALAQAGARISIIGSGDASMIDAYAKLLDCPFPIYTQPTKTLYKAFDMTHTYAQEGRGDYIQRSNMNSAISSITNFFKMGKFVNPGDFKQNGGEQVWTKDYKCVYSHNMKGTTDHAPITEVLEAANATSAIIKT